MLVETIGELVGGLLQAVLEWAFGCLTFGRQPRPIFGDAPRFRRDQQVWTLIACLAAAGAVGFWCLHLP